MEVEVTRFDTFVDRIERAQGQLCNGTTASAGCDVNGDGNAVKYEKICEPGSVRLRSAGQGRTSVGGCLRRGGWSIGLRVRAVPQLGRDLLFRQGRLVRLGPFVFFELRHSQSPG